MAWILDRPLIARVRLSQESPTPLYHPIPFNVSAFFLQFSVFQEEGRACLAVGEIL